MESFSRHRWLQSTTSADQSCQLDFDNENVTLNGSWVSQLDVGGPYPAKGHFRLSWDSNNAEPAGVNNGQGFIIVSQQNVERTTWPILTSTTPSTVSTAPTDLVLTTIVHTSSIATSQPASVSRPVSYPGLSGGAFDGIVVGTVLSLLLVLAGLWVCYTKRCRSTRTSQGALQNTWLGSGNAVLWPNNESSQKGAELATLEPARELSSATPLSEMDGRNTTARLELASR